MGKKVILQDTIKEIKTAATAGFHSISADEVHNSNQRRDSVDLCLLCWQA